MRTIPKPWRRPIVLLGFVVFACFIVMYAKHQSVSLEIIFEQRVVLKSYILDHFWFSVMIYVIFYTIVVALSIPGAVWLSLFGGFVFPLVLATILIVLSASIGASLVFLIARYGLKDTLYAKAGGYIDRMRAGFNSNAFSYMLVLRLIPLFPFFLVNIVPAFLKVSFKTYFFATMLGIIPGSFVFALAGSSVGIAIDINAEKNISEAIFQPQVFFSFVMLALMSLLPVIFRFLTRKQNVKSP